MYNWYAVDNNATTKVASNGGKNVCPVGWHIPTDGEWTTLSTYLGGDYAGGKLKETGTTHWTSPNTGATNSTGFTALPGGNRDSGGTYAYTGTNGNWWSSTEKSITEAWYIGIRYNDTYSLVNKYNHVKVNGFSVRCLKD